MAAPYPQIVLFGDSLFEGAVDIQDGFSLQAAIQKYTVRRYDVVNRGLSGYNTSQALRALPQLFPAPPSAPSPFGPKLAYLVVLLGANDAALPRTEENQHVALADYEANLKAILTHPHIQAHKPKILVVTPPPLNGIQLGQFERLTQGQQSTSRQAHVSAQYAEAARRVAQAVPGAALVDLWTELHDYAVKRTPGWDAGVGVLLGDELQPTSQQGYLEKLLTDGLHLSGEGYRLFWEVLRPHIELPASGTIAGYVFKEWRTAPWLEK